MKMGKITKKGKVQCRISGKQVNEDDPRLVFGLNPRTFRLSYMLWPEFLAAFEQIKNKPAHDFRRFRDRGEEYLEKAGLFYYPSLIDAKLKLDGNYKLPEGLRMEFENGDSIFNWFSTEISRQEIGVAV